MLRTYFWLFLLVIFISNISAQDDKFCKIRLPETINSYQPSILPVINFQGNTIYFDRKLHPNNINSTKDIDDVWKSQKDLNGNWTEPVNLGSTINSESSNVLFSLTPDGFGLFYGLNGEKGFSIARRTMNGWSKSIPVTIKNFSNKSENYFAYLSADKQILILAIEGKDSKGNLDLYVCFKEKKSYTYTEPKNLSSINTAGIEGSPFLAYDNKTLYFSSNGRKGIGKKDLYMTRRLDDSWEKWSEPKNLGPNINTPEDESSICMSTQSDSAYVVSWDSTAKREGIYEVCIPDSLLPLGYSLVFGKIVLQDTHGENRKIDECELIIRNDLNSDEISYTSDPETGEYCITLPNGCFAPIIVKHDGYDDFGFAVSTRKQQYPRLVKYNVVLTKTQTEIETEKVIIINPQNNIIYFDYNEFKLTELSKKIISNLIKGSSLNKDSKIEIYGYTDEKGTEDYNISLSRKRAVEVQKEFIKAGIKKDNIKIFPKGKTNAISNDSAKNRRAEIKIIK